MEEEKGNYFYILFIFIGVALMAVGSFYFFTSEEIKLNEEEKKAVEEEEKPTVINASDIKAVEGQESGIVTLNNDRTLNVSVSTKGENKSLDVNGRSIAIINDAPGYNLYTISDEFLLIEVKTNTSLNHFYVVNSEARLVKDIYEMANGTYAYKFEDDKLITSRFVDGYTTLVFSNKTYNICDFDSINSSTIPADFVVSSAYNLVRYKNGAFGLEFVKDGNVTLVEAQTSMCN